jgi:electron transfer flavoprotein alpha subunit
MDQSWPVNWVPTAEAVLLGTVSDDVAALGQYGVTKIHHAADAGFSHFDAQVYTKAIAEAATALNASVLVLSHNVSGKAIAPRLSARLKAGMVAGAVDCPILPLDLW